jgi:vancomycin resistance protein YoaR
VVDKPARLARLARVPSVAWVLGSALLGFVLALGVFAVLLEPPSRAFRAPEVHFLGAPLVLDQNATTVALGRLRKYTNGLFTLTLEGREQRVSFGDLGVELDKGRLGQLLRDVVDPTSPLSRWRRRQGVPQSDPLALPVPIRIDSARLVPLLQSIKDQQDRVPVGARLDLERRSVVPSHDGLRVDIDASVRAIERALSKGEVQTEIVSQAVAPDRRTEDLNDVRFDHILGMFETPYDRAARSEARTYNLRLAASRLDGTVLLPGEVFDFNRVVGPRDEANGYRVAPVIAEGELVDGIGGGTCQISGTLHGAAYFAGLEIVERYPHTRPSSYIKLGLDATVVYPKINFRFKNPFDHAVVLHEIVANGVVRAEVLGPKVERTVTMIRRVEAATSYDQVERNEPRLPRGERRLAQRGVPGFRVRMYRIVREGQFADREVWTGQYPPTTQVVLVGTGEALGRRPPHGDSHPEYLADELLVSTFDSAPEGGEPTLTESREPGRFGYAGWTKEAGMPVFDGGGQN